jgi:hypothetical protein
MFIRILIAFLSIILLTGCNLLSNLTPTALVVKTCTLIGCGNTLSIDLAGSVPQEYFMEVVTPAGEKMDVHCKGETGVYADDHFDHPGYLMCRANGVDLINFSPEQVTITLRWGADQQSTQTFTPVYWSERPNGPECDPECRIGQVTFQVPGGR